jgi:hypothetical protein
VIGYSQKVSAIYVEVFEVTCRPRGYLLILLEFFPLFPPFVNGGVGLLESRLAVVGYCKEKLKME